ncbi:MAG: PIG-L deacetylase family protein [Chloroflexota bacterium]
MSNDYIPERAMFIYAHPDDIEFGVAGTAAKWAKHGCEVTYVLVTDGNIGSHDKSLTAKQLADIRHAEQRAAADIVGVKQVIFMGEHDGLTEPTLELRKKIVKLIRQNKPNVVVCGDPRSMFPSDDYINHPDHRAVATAVVDAVFPASEMRLLYQEFEEEGIYPHKINYLYISYGPDSNLVIDITDEIDAKIAALKCHAPSQFPEWDPTEMLKKWSAENGKAIGAKYGERFQRFVLKEIE